MNSSSCLGKLHMQIHQALRQAEKPGESSQNSDGSPVFLIMVKFLQLLPTPFSLWFLYIINLIVWNSPFTGVGFISNSLGKTQTAQCYIVNYTKVEEGGGGAVINEQSFQCFLSSRNQSQITLYLALTFSKIDSYAKFSGSNSLHQKT